MDTRSRKFDRSMIPKIIAFLLAMIFVYAGTMRVMTFFHDYDKTNIDNSYYSNVFSQGNNFRLETSDMFSKEYNLFMDLALRKAVIYGNGTKSDYNELKEKAESSLRDEYESYKKSVIKSIKDDCDRIYYDTVIDYLKSGIITLTRLDSHKGEHKSGRYTYGEDDGYYEDDYGEDEYDEDEYVTTYAYSSESVTEPSAMTSTTHKGQISMINGIPTDIIEKSGGADAVVIICNTVYDSDTFDGYYAVDINDSIAYENFLSNYDSGENNVYHSYATDEKYTDFKAEAKVLDENLSQYKNLHFAFVDNKTGKVVSNLKTVRSNASASELKKIFLSYPWSFVRTSSDGFTQMGSSFKSLFESDEYSSIDIYTNVFGHYVDESYVMDYINSFTLYVCFDEELSEQDVFSEMESNYDKVYDEVRSTFRYACVILIGFLICVFILVVKSGRKHGDDELHMLYTDKIFTILRTAITAGIIFGLGCLFLFIYEAWLFNDLAWTLSVKLCSLCAVLIAAFLIDWILYIARHIKNGSLFKNLLIVAIFNWIFIKPIKKLHRISKEHRQKRRERPAVYKDIFNDVLRRVVLWIVVPNVVVGLISLLPMTSSEIGLAIFILLLLTIYDVFIVAYMLKYAYSLRKVFYALNQVKMGNYDVTIDTSSMPQTIRTYANDVMALNQGLSYAVDNAIKEQRMKTELITNVSHDLKTPLTSIITYVDLLSRCNIEDVNAREYIGVLGEKSARLKRLIEDLVEASKASSGAVHVELIKVSLNELTRQVTGEYADEFESRGLTLVEQEDEDGIIIMADSKLCYRVFDNLMSNVKKYAMPGTRVYLRIYKQNGKGVISLRNVSEKQLNIPAAELMARFVRGDKSRSSDGNGLGLSIAENFCKLQGGDLSLEINGDLFTATVEYKLSE